MKTRKDNLIFSSTSMSLNDHVNIIWSITRHCNFNCFYCYPKSKDKHIIDITKVIDFILSLKNKSIHITITGGEPTTHPRFLETIKYLADQCVIREKEISVLLLSNLSKSTNYYDEFFKIAENNKNISLKMFASFHREFMTWEIFLKRFKTLYLRNYNLSPFAFMIHSPECIELLNSAKEDILKLPFRISPLFHSDVDLDLIDKSLESESIKEKQYVIYYENGEYTYDYTTIKNQCFKGFICFSYKDQIVIEEDGSINNCQLFKSGKKLTIYDDKTLEYINTHEHILCPFNNDCHCGKFITKIDIKHFNDLKDITEKQILDNIGE